MITRDCSVPFFPAEDSKLRASTLAIRRGGNCPNSLEVLQQLVQDRDAVELHLVSSLPAASSPSTRRILDSFGHGPKHGPKVNLEHCVYRDAHSEAASSYIIRSQDTGSRTVVNYTDLPEVSLHEFEQVARAFDAGQETWWHFEVWSSSSPFTLSLSHMVTALFARKPWP